MRIVELSVICRSGGGSHGIVGYFTDDAALESAKGLFPSEDWSLSERELRLDLIFCRPAGQELLTSCIEGEMHGINPPSADVMAAEIKRNAALAHAVQALWMAGFLRR